MEHSVDIDPGADLLRVVFPVGTLLGFTCQVKGELSILRVDIDVVIVLQVVEEVAVHFELDLRVSVLDVSRGIVSALNHRNVPMKDLL